MKKTSKGILSSIEELKVVSEPSNMVCEEPSKNFVLVEEIDVYDNCKNYKGIPINCSTGRIGTTIGIYKTPRKTKYCERHGYNYKNCIDIYFKPSIKAGLSASEVLLAQLPLSCLCFSKKEIIIENSRGYFKEKVYSYISYKDRSSIDNYNTVTFIFTMNENKLILEKEGESVMKELYHDLLINATNVITSYEKVMKKGEQK